MKDDKTIKAEKPGVQAPRDVFECARFDVTDDLLAESMVAAYMCGEQEKNSEGEEKPYMPKFFPKKAVRVVFKPADDCPVEVFLLSKTGEWDSRFRWDGKVGKLSPEQMGQFFASDFYRRLLERVSEMWPTSDPQYEDLLRACVHKRMRCGFSEEELQDGLQEVDQPGKRTDLANKDTTGDGQRDYTSTGRRILHFGDMGVKGNSGECYCWPNPKFPFKWSQWKDWTKIKPLCKLSFVYNGRHYMISLSLFDENFDNRGFRGADTDWTPPLAWLTPGECAEVMKLSIVRRFTRQCVKRIKKYLSLTPQQVYDKINNQDKITVKEIEKTQRVIKHVISTALKQNQADTYCWD